MNISDVQAILLKAKLYKGVVDGIAGPKTWGAIKATETPTRSRWREEHRIVAAGQEGLRRLGYEPGEIDGRFGPNTSEALIAFKTKAAGGDPKVIKRVIRKGGSNAWPHQKNVELFFGPAGNPQCTAGKVKLPFAFTIAWNTSQKIVRFSCHSKVEGVMTAVFAEAAKHYGEKEYKRLELDIFGGCFNNRNMRGGSRKSMHAYGIAVDLNPTKNQLRWRADRAQFAKPEYDPFWNIVEKHGGVSGGRAWGKDYMHFQWARV